MTDQQIGQRERDRGHRVEERDLANAPRAEPLCVVEDHEHGEEVDERDQERAARIEDERRPVLKLRANLRPDEAPPEDDGVNHPGSPASSHPLRSATRPSRAARAPTPAARAIPTSASPWCSARQTSIGVCMIDANGSACAIDTEPGGKERQRQDHPGEEERDGERQGDDAADVDEPERRRVVEKAEAEADDDGERDAHEERAEVEQRGVVQLEHDRPDHERRECRGR